MDDSDRLRLLSLCAIRSGKRGPDWNVIARQAQIDRGVALLYEGIVVEQGKAADETRAILNAHLDDISTFEARAEEEMRVAEKAGARLVTVLDDDYPANLRLVHDLPPFLFYRGELSQSDARSVAVVGTRNASDLGLDRARKMARLLAERGVTVTSGLARGIDTAAHRAALDAGGRTLAVLGTGITKTYPAENRDLAERIAEVGALVSQFWPSTPPASWTFPRRNVVTSGISQGTVVIEASSTSGAKMQARLALGHGKRVWLLRSLVTDQEWARKYVAGRGAVEVSGVDEVVADLAAPDRVHRASAQRRQLTLL